MKKFLNKLILFIASLSILLIASDLIIVPQFAGGIFNEKYEYFTKKQQDFNLVFFGSSQTYRHFIPDSVDTKLGLNSFNYGMPSFIGYTRNTLFEMLYKRGHFDHTQYLLMEMGNFIPLDNIERKISTDNGRIFFTLKSYYNHLSYYLNLNAPFWFKANAFARLTKAYLRSRMKIPTQSYAKEIISSINASPIHFIAEKKGYKPFNYTYPEISLRRETLISNPEIVEKIKLNTHFIRQQKSTVNNDLLEVYESLIERCEKQGIHLIWVLNPLLAQSTDSAFETYYLKSILDELPHEHVIDLGDPEKYPELFKAEYMLDKLHLNNEGAKIYSAYLANELTKIIDQHRHPISASDNY